MDAEYYLNLDPDIKIINQASLNMIEQEKPVEELEEIKNRGNFLLRQELEDRTPVSTPNCIIINHIVFIVIFISFSIPILSSGSNEDFLEIEYGSRSSNNSNCKINFSIPKDIKSPIYVYYKLDNFYSNHIDFVKSKNYEQLRGEIVSKKTIDSSCKYMSKNIDHFKTSNKSEIISYANITMDSDSIMNPCGLIANSIFKDSYNLFNSNGKRININELNIAIEIDRNKIYKNDKNSELIQWLNKENEHFMVWMNMELFPNFIKKWGHIEEDLPKGNYTIIVNNNWGKKEWKVKKYFVLAKGNKFGSQKFFGYILVICSALEIIFIIIIFISKYKKRKFNPEEMKWD